MIKKIQWILLGATWLISLLFGISGFAWYAQIHNLQHTVWDNLYLTLQLIPLNSDGGIDEGLFAVQAFIQSWGEGQLQAGEGEY